jgi:prepilin-type N-terminal cleavage/methylation domain-containing protein
MILRRPGFTLMEIMLAIGIIVMLAAGMFFFYDYALSMRRRSQAAAEQTQLGRVITERMKDELTSVSAVTAFARTRSVVRGFSIKGGVDGTSPDGGMTGSRETMAYLTTRHIPLARFQETTELDEDGGRENRIPLYDVYEVIWHWSYDEEEGVNRGLYRIWRPAVQLQVEEEDQDLPDAGFDGEFGEEESPYERLLAERRGEIDPDDPAAMVEADEDAEPTTGRRIRKVELISSEVQWVYFRYYDGQTWRESFEPAPGRSAPVAVEVTIGFEPLLSAEELDAGMTVDEKFEEMFSTDEMAAEIPPLPRGSYRRVIRVPSGEMFSGGGGRVRSR